MIWQEMPRHQVGAEAQRLGYLSAAAAAIWSRMKRRGTCGGGRQRLIDVYQEKPKLIEHARPDTRALGACRRQDRLQRKPRAATNRCREVAVHPSLKAFEQQADPRSAGRFVIGEDDPVGEIARGLPD
jgi:hypothetical protein